MQRVAARPDLRSRIRQRAERLADGAGRTAGRPYGFLRSRRALSGRSANCPKLSYATDPLFRAPHDAAWNVPVGIDERFTLKKVEAALEDYRFDTTFDLVYFDAFAPDTQPELWSKELFARLWLPVSPRAARWSPTRQKAW